MNGPASSASPGYTTLISIAGYGQVQPSVLLTRANAGGSIRSLTIGNQTPQTVVMVYLASFPGGNPVFVVNPGNFTTLPIQASDNVTLTFSTPTTSPGGTVFVHADTQPLAASGFVEGITLSLPSTNTFLWVASEASGSVGGYLPPVFTVTNNVTSGPTEHIVRGRIALPVPNGSTTSTPSGGLVTLTGGQVFGSATGYVVAATIDFNNSTIPSGWNSNISVLAFQKNASSFQLLATNAPAVSTNALGSIIVDFLAIGT